MIEITKEGTDFSEVEVVSRGAWIKGVFSKIMKRLKPAHVGETQVINGVLFTIIEYAKGKFTAVAEGFDGLVKRGYDSWKKASFYKTAMAKDLVAKIRELGLMVLAITSQQKTQGNTNSDELHDLKSVYNLRSLKQAYRTLSKKFHPDMETGSANMFKLVKTIYDVRAKAIEMALDMFDENVFLFYEEDILAKKLAEKEYKTISLNSEKFIHYESQTIGKTFNYYKKMKQLFISKMYYHKNYNKINGFQVVIYHILNICRKIELLIEIPARKILKK